MPIENTTPRDQVAKALNEHLLRLDRAIIYRLSYIGEMAVNEARSGSNGKNYRDRTGNLRSSIGYVICRNGEVVGAGNWEQSSVGTDRQTGVDTGKRLAERIASQQKSGYCLIVVAGMNYATYVEDLGYNVLQSAETLAIQESKKLLNKLGING